MHYKRQYNGRPLGPPTSLRGVPKPRCTAPSCDKPCFKSRLYCRKHYQRWKRHGDPTVVLATERGTVRVELVVFNGIVFRRYPDSRQQSHRRYFKPGGQHIKRGIQALHQEVWKSIHGPIPPGYDVHHKDGDYANNAPENLQLVLDAEHHELHADDRSRRARTSNQRALLAKIRPKASEWHRSEEGRAWHREHARKSGFGQKRGAIKSTTR